MCSSMAATAGPAGGAGVSAVQQIAISLALRQLRQLRQGYLFNCSRPMMRTSNGDNYVNGFSRTPANSAGPAVSQKHQAVTNGRVLEEPAELAVISGPASPPRLTLPMCHQVPADQDSNPTAYVKARRDRLRSE